MRTIYFTSVSDRNRALVQCIKYKELISVEYGTGRGTFVNFEVSGYAIVENGHVITNHVSDLTTDMKSQLDNAAVLLESRIQAAIQ